MSLLFEVSSFTATLISSIVVVLYSSFGGIRAVTFTDMLQFIAFAVIIPITTFFLWQDITDYNFVFTSIAKNPYFDYKEVFNYQNSRFFTNISILVFFLYPSRFKNRIFIESENYH